MGKFLSQYKDALHKAQQERRQIRVGAVPIRGDGKYLILGRSRPLGMKNGMIESSKTHELSSGPIYEHESLETAVKRKLLQETGLDIEPEQVLGYLGHFDYEFKIRGGPGKKTQFNFAVDAGENPQVKTERSFSWISPEDINATDGNGVPLYLISTDTRRILTLPTLKEIILLRRGK
jgi:ADP-ribose pyrophosphatase YjhB (NUDIX family)